jgi:hypothetical protein
MRFKEFINEMPWTDYKGITIDYEFEKSNWVDKLIKNLDEYGPDIILKPFYNKLYKGVLQKKFKKLSQKDKDKLLDELPIKFVTDMKIG